MLQNDLVHGMVENGEITEAKNYTENTMGGMEAYKQLAATAYAEGDADETNRLLNRIDTTAAENEHEVIEKEKFLVLYRVLNEKLKYEIDNPLTDSLAAGKRHLSITDNEEQTIREVAATETRVALQAKKLLYLYKDEEFDIVPEPLPNYEGRMAKPKEKDKTEPIVKTNIIGIYPNPTTGNATVEFTLLTGKGELLVYNSLLQIVYSAKLNAGQTKVEIPDLSLSSGVYLCTVKDEQQHYKSSKIIITKNQ